MDTITTMNIYPIAFQIIKNLTHIFASGTCIFFFHPI